MCEEFLTFSMLALRCYWTDADVDGLMVAGHWSSLNSPLMPGMLAARE